MATTTSEINMTCFVLIHYHVSTYEVTALIVHHKGAAGHMLLQKLAGSVLYDAELMIFVGRVMVTAAGTVQRAMSW